MKVLVALDSFKGSLDSFAAGEAVRAGVLDAAPDASVRVARVADGGEGTLEAIVGSRPTSVVECQTRDALGTPRWSRYAVIKDGRRRCVVIEAALVIGLESVEAIDARLPPLASSAGLGTLLMEALHTGPDRVLVGLGGTATSDGGTGMLVSLGATLRDRTRRRLTSHPNPLWDFASLDVDSLPDLSRITVLCDVTNPLTGPQGAAQVFAPQKGATTGQVQHLEERLGQWAAALETAGRPVASVPGAGAAGGLGAALLACGADLVSGFDELARLTRLSSLMEDVDLVLTGEGSLDEQTAMGKGPAGVASLGHRAGALVVGLGGAVQRPSGQAGELFHAILPIHRRPLPLEEAMDPEVTAHALRATAGEVVRLVAAGLVGRGIPERP